MNQTPWPSEAQTQALVAAGLFTAAELRSYGADVRRLTQINRELAALTGPMTRHGEQRPPLSAAPSPAERRAADDWQRTTLGYGAKRDRLEAERRRLQAHLAAFRARAEPILHAHGLSVPEWPT